jgi:hypothetical protein
MINRRALDDLVVLRRTTRAALADQAGVSPQMLSDMANPIKRAGASPRTAGALADALGCSVETLFPEAAGFAAPDRAVA